MLNGRHDSVGGSLALWCVRAESCITSRIPRAKGEGIVARTWVSPVHAELAVEDGDDHRWRKLLPPHEHRQAFFSREFSSVRFKLNITSFGDHISKKRKRALRFCDRRTNISPKSALGSRWSLYSGCKYCRKPGVTFLVGEDIATYAYDLHILLYCSRMHMYPLSLNK